MEDQLVPKAFKNPFAAKKQKDFAGLPGKDNYAEKDHVRSLSELESGLIEEVQRNVHVDYLKGYLEPKAHVNCEKLGKLLDNAEEIMRSQIDPNDRSNAMAGYAEYHILDKVRRYAFSEMKNICTNPFNNLQRLGKEKEREEVKKAKLETLGFFLDLIEKYSEKKREGSWLFVNPKYLVSSGTAFYPLLWDAAKSFHFVYDDYPDFVRENFDAKRASDVFLKLIEDEDEDAFFALDDSHTAAVLNMTLGSSADRLLKILKNKDKNKMTKEKASSILHRLEFGRVNISKEGVEYLGKRYDLDRENNPDHFVRRLTSKGDIGIFNSDRILQKFFNLGDLSGDEAIVKPKIHEFIYETLFIGNENETEKERRKREKYLREFKENYFSLYDDDFFQKTGVRFNNLNFREQGWFLIHYKSASEEEKEDLLEFAKQYGENGIKSFLSLEFERENGNRIMEIGEKLGDDNARIIFNHLSRLADYVDQNNEELVQLFFEGSQDVSGKTFLGVRRELLQKAHEMIISFAKSLSTEENIKDDKIGKLLSDLEKNKTEIDLFHSLLKTIKGEGEKIDFEKVKNLDLAEKPIGEDLIEAEKLEILEIAEENYFNDAYRDNPEAAQRVIDELEAELFGTEGSANQRTYSLKYQGYVIAFCRFKPIEGKPGHLYAGSLNVYKDLRGLSVGGYFVRATLGKESKDHIIEAITRADNPVNKDYQKCGFVIDKENPFEKNGVKYFNMTMDRREKK